MDQTEDLSKLSYYQRYYRRHRDRVHANWRKYYDKHKAELNAKRCAQLKATYDPVKAKEKNRKYHELMGDAIRAKQREYRLKNLEKKRRECREWHAAHKNDPLYKAEHSKRGKANYAKNKSTILKRHKQWRKSNPGACRHFSHLRRALEKKATVNLKKIKEWMREIRSRNTAICYYCQKRISSKNIHFDHIVALSRGGSHSVENLCVSCQQCNLSKHDNPIRMWIRTGQQVMEL